MVTINQPLLRKLTHVQVPEGPGSSFRLPEFFVAGPQRTGSTWLARQLERHPMVWLKGDKEKHFFNLIDEPDHALYSGDRLSRYAEEFEIPKSEKWRRAWKSLQLFGEARSSPIAFDATACYAAMQPHKIEEVIALNPDLKVIISIRHLVTRTWSHAVHSVLQDNNDHWQQRRAELDHFFNTPYVERCNRFSETIPRWRKAVGRENVKVVFFDDLIDDSWAFFQDVCEFLQLPLNEKYRARVFRRQKGVNAAKRKVELPEEIREDLFQRYRSELDWIRSEFGRELREI